MINHRELKLDGAIGDFAGPTESNPVANTHRFTNARKNDSSSLVKPSEISELISTLKHTKAAKST